MMLTLTGTCSMKATFGISERLIGYHHAPPKSFHKVGKIGTPRTRCSTKSALDVQIEQEKGKGWRDARGIDNERLLNNFNALVVMASDRVEMHKILADQRDNWNHLFHTTITVASVSAATVIAMNGQMEAVGLSLVATILNAACAGLMALVNIEQPSQLAEEQRRAARFFRRLTMEIKATLNIDPQLRAEASAYWKEKIGTLHALDGAFPLPLSPNGLEKFPGHVEPAHLSPKPARDDVEEKFEDDMCTCSACQWTPLTEKYVREVSQRLQDRDIPGQIAIAEKARQVNLALARTSPILAAVSALLNGLIFAGKLSAVSQVSWLAATMTVSALFSHSLSHALQVGSFFEVHRNHAGFYADIQKSVEGALRLPRQQREDFKLFLLKFNLKLGHNPDKEVVQQDNHNADKLL